MSVYWDTSVVLKLYVEETDSETWYKLLQMEKEQIYSSELLKLEMAFCLAQKEYRGEVSRNGAAALFDRFLNDVAKGLYGLFPMQPHVFSKAYTLAFSHISDLNLLRTLDGIHLSTALQHGFRKIATADHRLAKAAQAEGLDVL